MIRAEPFSAETIRSAKSALGWVDTAARTQRSQRHLHSEFARHESFTVSGWVVCGSPHHLLDELYFVIDEEHVISPSYGKRRDDVAKDLADDSVRNCGFSGAIEGHDFSDGIHTLNIVGVSDGELYRLSGIITFSVLGTPEPAFAAETVARSGGRIRILRDTFGIARHDGRSPSAIRPGASLVIEGWIALTEPLQIPERLRILLVRANGVFAVEVQQRPEPEAGAAFGTLVEGCGYSAYIDCTPLEPGAYEIGFELYSAGTWSSVRSGRWIELMAYTDAWLPRALPVFADMLDAQYFAPVPALATQGDEFIVAGNVASERPIAAAFVRFNHEHTVTLTLTELAPEAARPHQPHAYEFAGLLQPMLVPAVHSYELLLLAQDRTGSWCADRRSLTIAAPVL